MTKRFHLLTAAALLAMTTAVAAADEDVLATVDGEPITQSDLDAYAEQRGVPPEQRAKMGNRLLEELIAQQTIHRDALRQGLDEEPEVIQQMERARMQVLIGAAVRRAATQPPVSEEELQATYEEKYAGEGGQEYNARHILVDEQEEATKIIAELDEGADFGELAEAHSTGPSGKQGGKLGWFSTEQMVAPFSEAVATMETGSHSSEPVKTQFGWHVIKLEDVRDRQPPALEEVREEILNGIRQQRVQAYVSRLREESDVEIKE